MANNTKKFDKRSQNASFQKDKKPVKNNLVFKYQGDLSLGDLANKISIPATDIISFLFLKKMVTTTINQTLGEDLIKEICSHFQIKFEKEEIEKEADLIPSNIEDDEASLQERPPVVVVMGHVDHGKTTLIDAIRDSHVADKEAGLITQHIGAYQKEVNGKKITFLDTPGHEAFTAMRARGASVTDIALIVVAADDGVMPQTVEAINHAKAANVEIIVVVNKIDKPTADIERVYQELSEYDLIPEEWGGSTIFCKVSAKMKKGIDELLETILVVSELLELKANPSRKALGSVIEASLDKKEGAKATLLVQNGTLRVGDYLVIGDYYCKVRRMVNEYKQNLSQALPSTPVVVTGIENVPQAGDHFRAFNSEKEAREVANARQLSSRNKALNVSKGTSLEELFASEGEIKNINIILKGDTTGSVEAVKSALLKLAVEGVKINIIHAQTGGITESDIILASASHALIYGFNVRPSAQVRQKADEEKVEIHLHNIIYALTEEIENAMKGLMKPVEVEEVLGQAEVRQTFTASKIGTIAGCYITDGLVKRNALCRIIRDGVVIYSSSIKSLKREKNDASEVKKGFECGITIENFNDIHEGDIIEAYEIKLAERK